MIPSKQKITFGKIQLKFKKNDEGNSQGEISSGFGTFGEKPKEVPIEIPEVDEVEEQMSKVMGFSGFGQKKAKNFDVQEMMQKAIENKKNIVNETPIVESEKKDDSDEESESEDEIGPPIPNPLKETATKELEKEKPKKKDK